MRRVVSLISIFISILALSFVLCLLGDVYPDEWICMGFLDIIFYMLLLFELEYERNTLQLSNNSRTDYLRPISLREFFAKKTRQLLIPWAFFAFLLFAYLFVLKLNETHNWAKAISLPVTSMFDGFLGDENSFILFHVIWFLICLFEVSFVYLLIHKITPTIKH